MSGEVQTEHRFTALFVGDLRPYRHAAIDSAKAAGWRFLHLRDVYTAAAWLLNAGDEKPSAILLAVETLLGDELRFLDFLARRWPSLPVAACYTSTPDDRRLETCRRKGVAVVAASAIVDWLVNTPRGERKATIEPEPAKPPGPKAEVSTARAKPKKAHKKVSEAVATQPDVSDAGASKTERLHLTPWSPTPRTVPRRKPPAGKPLASQAGPSASASQEPSPPGYTRNTNQDNELLTREELQALLGKDEEPADGQEGSQ